MAAPGTARPGVRRARGTAMTRHYHDIGGGADLVLPRRRRAAALLSSGSLRLMLLGPVPEVSLDSADVSIIRSNYKLGLYGVRELRHDRDEREQRDPGREHRQTELRVAIQFPRLGSDVDHAVLSLRLRPGDDACVCVDYHATRRVSSMAWMLDDVSRPRRRSARGSRLRVQALESVR